MRALGVMEFGGPEALSLHEAPTPEPAEGQLRIRVMAVAVNPADGLLRAGVLAARLTHFSPPYIPGMDVYGVVDDLGPTPDGRFTVGDEVIAIAQPTVTGGSYAEFVVVPTASTVKAPKGISGTAASTLLMNAETARLAVDALALQPGQVVAVTGAAGAVGGYSVQLAIADGLIVVADASDVDADEVKALGATHVVPRGENFAASVRALFPDGVDGLIDASNQRQAVVGAVRDGGEFSSVKGWDEVLERGISCHVIWVTQGATDTPALERLRDQAENGVLTMRVAAVVTPEHGADTHRALERRGQRGRQVIDFSVL